MTPAQELFHQIAAEMPDAKEGKMFGALCIKAPNGKAGVMFWRDYMVFKLPPDALQEALSLDGAQNFDPMDGRPMKEWVQLPYAYSDMWKNYAEHAMAYVATLKK